MPADGKGEPTVLLEAAQRMYPNAWSPDGRYLMFQQRRPETGWDLLSSKWMPRDARSVLLRRWRHTVSRIQCRDIVRWPLGRL